MINKKKEPAPTTLCQGRRVALCEDISMSNRRAAARKNQPTNAKNASTGKPAGAIIPINPVKMSYEYYLKCDDTYCAKVSGNGIRTEIHLANFNAKITRTIDRHEAGLVLTSYRIEATCEKQTREITVKARDFAKMDWVGELGGNFMIDPGREVKDLLRHSIQSLSGEVPADCRAYRSRLDPA